MYVLILFLVVFAVGYKGLHVHGPADPVVAQLGVSVLLPCFTESPLPLEGLQVEWRKMESDSLVSLFQKGETKPDLQSHLFRGRADFFPNEVFRGNFSILLQNVVEEDAGGYRCRINTNQNSNEVTMEIRDIERFMVREADQVVFAHVGEDVILNCSVNSQVSGSDVEEVTWKKADGDGDVIVLLYQEHELFPDSSHERYQGRVDFFPSEISKGNFSLKLMGVRREDNGEFVCEVHTKNNSARTIVVLQGIGFSTCHMSILVLCCVALLLTLGLSVPTFNNLRKKVASGKGMMMHAALLLCPNICLFVAFGLWATEGRLYEVVTCTAVSIGRPLLLTKAAPYLDRLPMWMQKSVKSLAVPLYYSIITVASCSVFFGGLTQARTAYEHIKTVMAVVTAVSIIGTLILAKFDLHIYSTVCLEIFNGALIALFLHHHGENCAELCSFTTLSNRILLYLPMPAALPPLIMALMMALILQKHFFQENPFRCLHISLASAFVTLYSLFDMMLFVLMGILMRGFAKLWMFPFEVVMYISAWIALVFLLRNRRQGCCSQRRRIGYFCCTVMVLFVVIAFGALCLHFATVILQNKEGSDGYVALTVLAHVLAATSFFQHPKHLPDFLHIMIYMFGSVGLVIINSVVLVVELIQQTGKGARTIGDLRVIILTSETVFVSAWLALQIYDAWVRLRNRKKPNLEDEHSASLKVLQEMEVLSVQTS